MRQILKISIAAAAAVVLAASCQKEIPAPSVTLESSYEIVVGEELTITPVYKNCEGAVYTWTLNEQVIGNEASLVYTFPEAGDFAVSVSVETEGGNAQASTNVKVKENTAVLTFEGEYWDALIDDPQYGGPLSTEARCFTESMTRPASHISVRITAGTIRTIRSWHRNSARATVLQSTGTAATRSPTTLTRLRPQTTLSSWPFP